jgi:hypothetical protein
MNSFERRSTSSNRPLHITSKRIQTGRNIISKKTYDVYKACQSSPNSYRAKKSISHSIDLEKSRLQLEKSIQQCKAKLTECNERIQEHTVKVPAMRVLRNLIRKLYEADNYFMRSAFLLWKNYTDCLRQQELSIRQTAQRIKLAAQELVRDAITSASKQVELTIRRRELENVKEGVSNVERWSRTKSMYNMTSKNFKPRGSLFRLPDTKSYKSKLLQDKKLLS